MTYATVEKILAATGFQMVKRNEVIDGTSLNYKDDQGRSALVFIPKDSRYGRDGMKALKGPACPHCGKNIPPEKEGHLLRENSPYTPSTQIILHYNDEAGKWQNVVTHSKKPPTEEELMGLWEKSKKPGYGPVAS